MLLHASEGNINFNYFPTYNQPHSESKTMFKLLFLKNFARNVFGFSLLDRIVGIYPSISLIFLGPDVYNTSASNVHFLSKNPVSKNRSIKTFTFLWRVSFLQLIAAKFLTHSFFGRIKRFFFLGYFSRVTEAAVVDVLWNRF